VYGVVFPVVATLGEQPGPTDAGASVGGAMIAVASVTELFARSGSGVDELAETELVFVPASSALAKIVIVARSP
jgi:hypothetical protein